MQIPDLGSGASAFQYVPVGSPWTFSGLAGVSGNGSAFTSGNPGAPQGSQVAFIQTSGSISQSVNLSAGTYVVMVDAAQRSGSQQQIQILVDNNPITSITPTGTSYALYNTTSFTVTTGVHTITVKGLNPQGGDNTALIDQVFLDWV